MAKPRKVTVNADHPVFMPAPMISPLAKEMPGPITDAYTQSITSKPWKTRGVTVFNPEKTTEALAYTNAPSLKDCFTVDFDRPDYNSTKMRPRYDGLAHRLPEGDGVPRRK